MLVGLISDTHDRLPMIRQGVELLLARGVSAVIHPGDLVAPFAARLIRHILEAAQVPLYVTYGNNDGERVGLKAVLPQIQDGPLHLALDACPILVHHFQDWCPPDDVARARIVVTGHTHEVSVVRQDGRLFVNPGECCGWLYGRCTVAVLDTAGPSVEICDLAPT